MARRFPDGQLCIDLRGAHTETPLKSFDVLALILTDLGVDAANLPANAADRSRLFRQRVAGLRLLFVFDNAADADQVRRLMPGDPSCAVIVTSRKQLVTLEGADIIELPELDVSHAKKLLENIVGLDRVNSESSAALDIIKYCGQLPLAVRIAGARLAARPAWSLRRLADRLADESRILDELESADFAIRIALSFSYESQSSYNRSAFRTLAIMTAPNFTSWPVAAALNCSISAAENVLDELAESRLIDPLNQDEAGQLRYQLHDLVREYARERFAAEESAEEKREAIARIASRACACVTYAEQSLMPGTPTSGKSMVRPAETDVERPAEFMRNMNAWLSAEITFILHTIRDAYQAGLYSLTWELAEKLVAFLDPRAMWDEWQTTHDLGLEAAKSSSSVLGEATMLRNLAILHRLRGRSDLSELEANQAIILYADINDLCGQGDCMANLAWIYRRRGNRAAARQSLNSALKIFESHAAHRGEAWAYYMLADLEIDEDISQALLFAKKAVRKFELIQDMRGLGWALRLLSDINRENDSYSDAMNCYIRAAEILQTAGDRRGTARALGGLAALYDRTGMLPIAARQYENCFKLFNELGDDRWELKVTRELRSIYLRMGKRRLARLCVSREQAIEKRNKTVEIEPALRL
jgi:tetratricopeptide (TPR) repeat protein